MKLWNWQMCCFSSPYNLSIAHVGAQVQLAAPGRRPQLSNVLNQHPSPAVPLVSSCQGKREVTHHHLPLWRALIDSPRDPIHHLYPVKNSKSFFPGRSKMILYFVNAGPDSVYYNLQLSFFIIISYLIACPSLVDAFAFVSN